VKIRIVYRVPPTGRFYPGRPAFVTLGYELSQLAEAIGDWWVLWRAGRRPRAYLDGDRSAG
jgi:hypothetical protein